MELNNGQRVLFARNYRDTPQPGVIVRDVGTFYIGTEPPTGVNVVEGKIEPIRRNASFPIYSKFMNFNKQTLLACNNVQVTKEDTSKLLRSLDTDDMLHFNSAREAREAFDILKHNHVRCQLRGDYIVGIYDMERAKVLLQPKGTSKRHSLYRSSRTTLKADSHENFEI